MEPGAKRRTGKEKETLAAVPLFPARLFTMAGEYAGDDGDGMGLAGFDEGVVEGDQRWVPLAAAAWAAANRLVRARLWLKRRSPRTQHPGRAGPGKSPYYGDGVDGAPTGINVPRWSLSQPI
jgi:hypothetical protein